MTHCFPTARGEVAIAAILVAVLAGLPDQQSLGGPEPARNRSRLAWTLDEAMAQLALNPHDAYLQYVALQLARRENRLKPIAHQIEGRNPDAAGRAGRVDLFGLFTGALAVQESLQLDTMRGGPAGPVPGRGPVGDHPPESVTVANLAGPSIKSHPWKTMLAGKTPAVSPLARYVPDDDYFVEFRSLNALLDAAQTSDLWGTYLFNQVAREARTQLTAERIKDQLVLETDPRIRPFYDLVVDRVALAGSDLFLREGSDLTVLFQFKHPALFKARMEGFLADAAKARPDARRTTGEYRGISYVHLATPDRRRDVYAAYPLPNLHVRSNSRVAFERVLDAIHGTRPGGTPVRRLGDTAEFADIRTLMPLGDKEEDGFVYLSDPFIRRLVGPQLKLTERRRMVCDGHLRMIAHAALLYRTEFGKPPGSLAALADAQCSPGVFGTGRLACPDGGEYSLAADGASGICSHHGRVGFLTPCCEIPVSRVTTAEAEEYRGFLTAYNQYWRTFFDPIALRVRITPRQYRLETIVLPLIDNSIYTGLARILGGKPEPLDALPVPRRTIFTVAVQLNKEAVLQQVAGMEREFKQDALHSPGPAAEAVDRLKFTELVSKGLGDQVGLNVYDAVPTFDFNLPSFLGFMASSFNGHELAANEEVLIPSFLVASLNAPVYISIPVRDPKVVDQFLAELDNFLAILARQPQHADWLQIESDSYRLQANPDRSIHCYGLRFGPVQWRVFWARIGGGLYIASKPFILDDLRAAEPGRAGDRGPVAHAMVRIRPEHWDRVLADFRLGWAEHNREACLNNLGPLSGVGRALAAAPGSAVGRLGAEVQRYADRLYGVHFFCPEGGRYVLSADGKEVTCPIHGSARSPAQPAAPAGDRVVGELLGELTEVTAALTFLPDGLHAVMTVERKPAAARSPVGAR